MEAANGVKTAIFTAIQLEQSLVNPTRPDQTWFMKNIQEAKTHLSRLVEQAAAGEEIIIAKSGKPMARLVAYQPPQPVRCGGFLAGKIWESGDCWESDDDLIKAMTGDPIEPSGGIPKVAEDSVTYRTGK